LEPEWVSSGFAPASFWGRSDTEIYAAGHVAVEAGPATIPVGAVKRFDGSDWSAVPGHPEGGPLWDIWGDEDELWVVGRGGQVYRYGAGAWADLSLALPAAVYAVVATPSGDVVVSGTLFGVPRMWRRTAAGPWQLVSVPGDVLIRDLWTDGDTIVAVGGAGTICRVQGLGCVAEPSATPSGLYAVWGSSAASLYAVGARGTALRYDGDRWRRLLTRATENYVDVHVNSSGRVLALKASPPLVSGGYSVAEGPSFFEALAPGLFLSGHVSAVGDEQLFIGVIGGEVVKYDHGVVSPTALTAGPGGNVSSLWARNWTEAYAVASPDVVNVGFSLQLYNGVSWQDISPANPQPQSQWTTVAGDSSRLAVAGTAGVVFLDTGSGFVDVSMAATTGDVVSLWLGDDALFALARDGDGIGHVLSYDGSWTEVFQAAELRELWASSATDLWALTSGGAVYHYDGVSWRLDVQLFGVSLAAIGGSGPDDIFVAGTGRIYHYDGNAWAQVRFSENAMSFVDVTVAGDRVYFSGAPPSALYRPVPW
jgi:hypothetical protein